MKRHLPAVLSAFILAVTTYFVLQYLYSSGHLDIDVSDGHGHGPDHDTVEWSSAVRSAISFQAAIGGALVGIAVFGLCSWWWSPSRTDSRS